MGAGAGSARTRVGREVGELAVMWAGFPLLGAGAGWLLVAAAGPLARLPWVPLQGWLKLLAGLPRPGTAVAAAALGVLAGLVVAGLGTRERPVIDVDAHRVRLRREGRDREHARAAVRVVFVDGQSLVLLGDGDGELDREDGDMNVRLLAAAFRTHGWPWADADPHRDAYRRWVEGLPGLPAGADALLRARQQAVEQGRHDEARDLRRELGRLGVVVRDEEKRQYWRRSPPGSGPGSGS
ncbi:YqeB family protein [Micromonospora okii]|uniref:YqeB family protein n=1 Tax=Micromonospora okii TaxID=1182970 RepID=UPI001E58A200|nr:hypothetical protein [Micromonospora okii]